MKNRLRILYVSSEIAPFAKTGGLADVGNALPKALTEIGHEIRLMMPKYGCINERRYTLREVIRLKDIPIKTGDGQIVVAVKSAFLPDTKIQVYFLDHRPSFGRRELYVDPDTNTDYPDNGERFAIFCRGVLETLKILHWEPHIIHCNDWQTALIPLLLKTEYANDPFFCKTSTVLTLHNAAYQGVFDSKIMDKAALPAEEFSADGALEFYGKVNYLKGGCISADHLTTVSKKYAKEICSDPEFGGGLEGVLSAHNNKLSGILNGIDYDIWSPEKDNLISHNYTSSTFVKKVENKKTLLEKINLKPQNGVPVIGMISRLAEQKGFDLLIDAMDELMKLGLQLVILGDGDDKYRRTLNSFQKKYGNKFSLTIGFDNELAHLIEAGSDLYLMPSRFEPCGLNQMYSLSYGTIPIVRATGGLADTIEEIDLESESGNGFVFEKYTAIELVNAVKRALKAYADKETWQRLAKKVMKQNFSWSVSAEQYVKIYSKLEVAKRKK